MGGKSAETGISGSFINSRSAFIRNFGPFMGISEKFSKQYPLILWRSETEIY